MSHEHCLHTPEEHEGMGWTCDLYNSDGPCCGNLFTCPICYKSIPTLYNAYNDNHQCKAIDDAILLTLKIPRPKYQKGDVVRWGRPGLILHIYSVTASGQWEHLNGETEILEDGIYYNCTVQDGCGPEGDVIRPGTYVGFPERIGYGGHHLCNAEKIAWERPIIEPDNMGNICERWEISTNAEETKLNTIKTQQKHTGD